MRVRIIKKPSEAHGIDGNSLQVGRVYNLDSALASTLMLEGCAECYDLLTSSEKREFRSGKGATAWAADRLPRFKIWRSEPSDPSDPSDE